MHERKIDEIKQLLVEEEHLDPLQMDQNGGGVLHHVAKGGHLDIILKKNVLIQHVRILMDKHLFIVLQNLNIFM